MERRSWPSSSSRTGLSSHPKHVRTSRPSCWRRACVGRRGPEGRLPLHKKQFDLSSGKEISDGDLGSAFEAKVEMVA